MNVLVTGATGFIGQHLVKRLLDYRHKITIIARNPQKAKKLFGKKVSIIPADITDKKSLESLPRNTNWLFHLAAAVSYHKPQKKDFYQTNVKGTQNLLQIAQALPHLKKLVYVSSVGVYGPIKTPPANETSPHKPQTDYEISKHQGEKLTKTYIKKGLPINIIQPTLVYGPQDTASGMFTLFKTVTNRKFMPVGKKPALMHPLYIENLIDALLLAAKTKLTGHTFIIGDQNPLPLKQLAQAIAKATSTNLLPFSLPLPFAQTLALSGNILNFAGINFPFSSRTLHFMIHHRAYQIAKAEKLLNYHPQITTQQGIKKTAKWYQKQKIL